MSGTEVLAVVLAVSLDLEDTESSAYGTAESAALVVERLLKRELGWHTSVTVSSAYRKGVRP